NDIIDILKGARQYSGYDITPIIEQIRQKIEWLRNAYPDHFGLDEWQYDLDKDFSEDISKIARKRNHDIEW
ncbi:MAG: hypothetical protein J6C58_01730, partial [Bacteroidaceae bacterium]|nr:hypothetical protein [Bacteroidaceae bacterium]